MSRRAGDLPEIESFNLADLDVAGLDMRLELTTLIPQLCVLSCGSNHDFCECHSNGGCECHSLIICQCYENDVCGVHK